jgi:hypothetical protein
MWRLPVLAMCLSVVLWPGLPGAACAKKKTRAAPSADFQAIGNKAMQDFQTGAAQ